MKGRVVSMQTTERKNDWPITLCGTAKICDMKNFNSNNKNIKLYLYVCDCRLFLLFQIYFNVDFCWLIEVKRLEKPYIGKLYYNSSNSSHNNGNDNNVIRTIDIVNCCLSIFDLYLITVIIHTLLLLVVFFLFIFFFFYFSGACACAYVNCL